MTFTDDLDASAPTAQEAMADFLLDQAEAPHDCGSCEWCVEIAKAAAKMVPTAHINPPF
jgi:hypothetical protein